jgi:DNA helicase II / ATP-dependent DNA helicase PcrA
MDQADAADLLNIIRNDLGLGQGPRRFPRKDSLADIYLRVVNARQKVADVLETTFPWCASEVDGIKAVIRGYRAQAGAGRARLRRSAVGSSGKRC